MSSSDVNYAKLFGFHSIAAAVVFAILYIPLLGWFARQSFAIPTYVHFVLTLFCAIRIAAFVIRAILAGSESAGHNLSLFIGDEVLLSVGFFGLLYSAYTLVLDRETLSDEAPQGFISKITRNRHLFRLTMTGAVVLGIVGLTKAQSSNQQDVNTGTSLRQASTVIFLVLTILQAYQTIVMARLELSSSGKYRKTNESIGMKYGSYILLVISLLLLVREVFTTATMKSISKQNNESLWYPLLALPELLAVILYASPGLVPPRSELPNA